MSVSRQFAILTGELCSFLYVKDYNKDAINSLIDELNAKPFKSELFVGKQVSLKVFNICTIYLKNNACILFLLAFLSGFSAY